MEVISIDGIEYEKVTSVAKRFKYTTDYIGQLCRAGKVEAKLIGRTWYVHAPSLKNHKSVRYQKTGVNDKTIPTNLEIESSRISVEPVLTNNAAKTFVNKVTPGHYAKRVNWKPLTYLQDESALLPNLRADKVDSPIKLSVDLAESSKVPVTKVGEADSKLVPDQLAAIALHGSVSIQSAESFFDDTQENIAISPISVSHTLVAAEESVSKRFKSKAVLHPSQKTATAVSGNQTVVRSLDAGITKPITVEQIRPVVIGKSATVTPVHTITQSDSVVPFPWFWLSMLTGLFVAALVLVTITEVQLLADTASASKHFSFSERGELLLIWQKVINIF